MTTVDVAWGAFTQVQQLTAPDGAAEDQFGNSVAVNGDVIVVGVREGDLGANLGQGMAYVFERNSGGENNWGQVQHLMASDGAASDLFGYSPSVMLWSPCTASWNISTWPRHSQPHSTESWALLVEDHHAHIPAIEYEANFSLACIVRHPCRPGRCLRDRSDQSPVEGCRHPESSGDDFLATAGRVRQNAEPAVVLCLYGDDRRHRIGKVGGDQKALLSSRGSDGRDPSRAAVA